jgi:hypothetical protein
MDEDTKNLIGKGLKLAGQFLEDKPSEQALLTEYQVCQQDQNANVQSYWTLSGIFIAFTSVLLGGLIYGVLSNKDLLKYIIQPGLSSDKRELLMLGMITVVLGAAVLVILWILRGWLKRVNLASHLHYKRMREIELKLGLRKSFLIEGLDNWKNLKKQMNSEEGGKNLIRELNTFYEKWNGREEIPKRYEPSSSTWHHRWIIYTLLVLWFFVLVAGCSLVYLSECGIAFWALLSFLVILCMIILLWGKRKKDNIL